MTDKTETEGDPTALPIPYVPMRKRDRPCQAPGCNRTYRAAAATTVTCCKACWIAYRTQRCYERSHGTASVETASQQSVTAAHGLSVPFATFQAPEAPIEPPAFEPMRDRTPVRSYRLTDLLPAVPAVGTRRDRSFVWVSDIHAPYEDPKAVSLALQVTKHLQPDLFVAGGDWIDCLAISQWPHDVGDPKSHLQYEIDVWHQLANAFREVSLKSERTYIEGNHEARFPRYLWRTPAFRGLEGFNLPALMKLESHGFKPEMVRSLLLAEDALTFHHGSELGGQFAGLAARKEMARIGTSGLTGHSHRLCKYLERSMTTLKVWIEGGCCCLNPQKYIKGLTANWQQGVVVGHYNENGNDFDMETVEFRLSGRARIDGKEFTA